MTRHSPSTPHLAGILLLAGILVGVPVAATLGVPHAAAHVQPKAAAPDVHAHDHGHAHAHPHAHDHSEHLATTVDPTPDAGHGHEHRDGVPPHRHELDPATSTPVLSWLHGPGRSVSPSATPLTEGHDLRRSGLSPTLDRPGPDPPKRRSLLCVLLL